MIELLPQAAGLIFTVEGIGVLVLGTMLGVILGALPGIGSTVAVAMILPFTLTMSQAPAILMLLAVYAGSVYGGSISAILINRLSGTVIIPILGSIVQKGKFAAWALALDKQLKSVDFPTFGNPMIPHFKAMLTD